MVSCRPDSISRKAHRCERRWAFSFFGIEHCWLFRRSSIIAAFRMCAFPCSTQSLTHFGVIAVQTSASRSPFNLPRYNSRDYDCQQDLHCLWEEAAGRRLQWLGKDSRRARAHLPGVHKCPPARALPIGSQTPARKSPSDGHSDSTPARRREDGSRPARCRHNTELGLDLRDDARRSYRPR